MHIPGEHFLRNSGARVSTQAPERTTPLWLSPPLRGRMPALRPARLLYLALLCLAVIGTVIGALALRRGVSATRTAPKQGSRSAALPVSTALPAPLFFTEVDEESSAIFALQRLGDPQPVFRGDGEFAGAVAAPDGSRIVYLHAACPRCTATYEVRSLATGALRVVGSAPRRASGEHDRADAAWAPDGHRLAFTEQGLDAPSARIYLLDDASGTRRPLSPYDAGPQQRPVWSPDGRSIAYLAGGDESVISTIDVQTGAVRLLNDQLDHTTDLAWSPDGRYLSVLRLGELWLVEVSDGRGFQLGVPGRVVSIGGWSPGSTSLAVTATDQPSVDGTAISRVLVVPVRGGPPLQVSSGPNVGQVRCSPDGRLLAWTTAGAAGWSIWSAPASGGPAGKVATGRGRATLNSWR